MPEMHLRQSGFIYSASGPFTKNKEKIKKFKETGDSRCICQNELDKVCFEHNLAYWDFNELNRRTIAYKVLHDKEFDISKNPKHDGYQRGFPSMVYKFFDKKSSCRTIENEIMSNKQIAEELYKSVM